MLWALIYSLLLRCCPTAVSGFVVAIIVNAIESEAGRLFAHVSKEIFKRKPAFADGDTAAAVIDITALLTVAASGQHPVPANVRWAWSVLPVLPPMMSVFCLSLMHRAST